MLREQRNSLEIFMKQSRLISKLNLRPFGQKGWLQGDITCPKCSRGDKFGVLLSNRGGVARCFYCSVSVPLFRVLRDLGLENLLEYDFVLEEVSELPPLSSLSSSLEVVKDIELPIGFTRIYYDDYLNTRHFTLQRYEEFGIGISTIDPRTKGKIIFQIFQFGKPVAWLARSKKSKEWHKENLRRHKEFSEPLVLRYRNSENDFSKILGGLDKITPSTHTVILVEGLFDSTNIERLMGLELSEEIKCCFTFGSSLSEDQVTLIPDTVSEVILMYDPGAIVNMKLAGGLLLSRFSTKVALIKDTNIDPGNIDKKKLLETLSSLEDYIYFYTSLY